jgi:hypothetical protein
LLGGLLVEECHGFVECQGVDLVTIGQPGVELAVLDVGPVAPGVQLDRLAIARMRSDDA